MTKLTYPWRSEKDEKADEELRKLPCIFTRTKESKRLKNLREEAYIERMIEKDKESSSHE